MAFVSAMDDLQLAPRQAAAQAQRLNPRIRCQMPALVLLGIVTWHSALALSRPPTGSKPGRLHTRYDYTDEQIELFMFGGYD